MYEIRLYIIYLAGAVVSLTVQQPYICISLSLKTKYSLNKQINKIQLLQTSINCATVPCETGLNKTKILKRRLYFQNQCILSTDSAFHGF